MKIQKFLYKIQEKLVNNPSTDIKTLESIMNLFDSCLSKLEREKYWISLEMCKGFTFQQLSLKDIETKIITTELENKLNDLKNHKN